MPLAVCATPIGNLDDVTLRVLAELRAADLVLCEDTRRTRVLLARHGSAAKRLVSYHEHNEARRVAEVLPRLEPGERVALVSDAGLPGISDPGVRLIDAALAAGLPVTVLPGPSAVETALVASGLAFGDGYRFLGYLPRRAARSRRSGRSWPHRPRRSSRSSRRERLPASLASLARAQPERRVAVCRELTKRFEEVVRGSAAEVAERFRRAAEGRDHARARPARRAPARRRWGRPSGRFASRALGVPRRRGGGDRRRARRCRPQRALPPLAGRAPSPAPSGACVRLSQFDTVRRSRYLRRCCLIGQHTESSRSSS